MLGCHVQSPAAQMLGIGGLAELVHHDAVVAVEPGLAGERVRGRDANRDEHEVGGDVAAVDQPHCRDAFGAGRRSFPGAVHQLRESRALHTIFTPCRACSAS